MKLKKGVALLLVEVEAMLQMQQGETVNSRLCV